MWLSGLEQNYSPPSSLRNITKCADITKARQMSRAERRALVERENPTLPVSQQCRLLAVSRSSTYGDGLIAKGRRPWGFDDQRLLMLSQVRM
jgi:hypothetical protein